MQPPERAHHTEMNTARNEYRESTCTRARAGTRGGEREGKRERLKEYRKASYSRTDFLLTGASRRAKIPNGAVTIVQTLTDCQRRSVFRTTGTKSTPWCGLVFAR